MRISEIIKRLEEEKEKHGDLKVCYVEEDDYWGKIETEISYLIIDDHAQPEGPKSGVSEKALILK